MIIKIKARDLLINWAEARALKILMIIINNKVIIKRTQTFITKM
jgi:hypothetical protein